mmetsp:Transcript_10357/g.43141  ORF Transcript_10357/g.43141 Transcript_10357/m.43141 type:complete len:511 (-) Transcript_10357:4319-5851(-)|eukprot:CAMPEP_0113960744 /NCGR_PEP_ID=MMETSP0011_2-20120614/4895_1 /TAXON_ID=101924 /ORGANISM="Rhodosorus marinus" /LENGTH=510 /DNA_ID=CAMNT_0000972251 /DNA_START=166 /DNA_END=1698 /DNA_ORIENTATION=- /assembly_acc=CAM_ASM_000156
MGALRDHSLWMLTSLLILIGTFVGATDNDVGVLLGPKTDQQAFVADYLDKEPLLVRLDERSDDARASWIKLYRSFLPGDRDLDALLSRNLSAYKESPLVYKEDIMLEKPGLEQEGEHEAWVMKSIENLWPNVADNASVPIASVHSVFKDGFRLRMSAMELRSKAVFNVTQYLQDFLSFPVTSQLLFVPPGWMEEHGMESLAEFSADDRWVIQLDGEQTVQLSVPEVQKPYPHLEYTPNGPFNGSALPETTLKEGDVLYIPRGFIVQSGTHTEKPSMHLVVHVESHRQTFRDALITVITCCLCPKAKDIILTPLGESNTHTWYHVIVAAVKVGADISDEMRHLFPCAPAVIELEKTRNEKYNPMNELATRFSAFFESCKGVFMEPFLNTLELYGDYYADEEVLQWAEKAPTVDLELFDELITAFKGCIDFEKATLNVQEMWPDANYVKARKLLAELSIGRYEKEPDSSPSKSSEPTASSSDVEPSQTGAETCPDDTHASDEPAHESAKDEL